MNYQQAAQSALDVQDACNLSGVLFSFADAMHAICEKQNELGEGTEWKNRHAIVTLYLAKLADLNGGYMNVGPEKYQRAADEVIQIAGAS